MLTGTRSVDESAARLSIYASALSHFRWVLLGWILFWTGSGLAYVIAVKPEFVAKVDILLEPRHIANDGPEDQRHYHQVALDSEQAETELRVLRSESLLRPIFDQLHLAKAPELAGGHNGFWSMVAHGLHRFSPTAIPYDAETRAFYAFVDRVDCLRLGLSYVIELNYRSQNPTRAAQVANALAAAYLDYRLGRMWTDIQRVGGPYRAARAGALIAQIAETRAAIRDGSAPVGVVPYADVRLLGAAVPPLVKAHPKTVPTILFAMGFGAISGVMLVLLVARRRSPATERQKVVLG